MKDYKKILEGVVDIINITKESDIGFANICAYIGENCPELKESDDERVRKGIIRNLEYLMDRAEGFVKDELKERIAWLEKQGEQKSADRVKLMFKVGDWIIYDRHISKVKDMDSEGYLVEDTYGDEGILPKEFAEKHYHLWTITEDAKDGDVLADDRAILLFRNLGNKNWKNVISYYAILETNLNNRFSISDGEEYWGKVEDCELKPATKEQCDTLEKAMADAGYTFDFEKKKLNKIEPKLVEWSEEDETVLNNLIYALANDRIGNDRDEYVSWLKSLKERVQPQNSSVTDEELAQAKKEAYNDALDKIEYNSGEPTFDDGWSAAIWYLKKRNGKPQNTWKPSDEQMEILWKYAEQNNYDGFILTSLHQQLKKLREE